MNRNNLINYYNKFCEDKRLESRHGQVEFNVTMTYIMEFIKQCSGGKILDIGAGTGRYSIFLSNLGYDVAAIELVKYNLGILKSKQSQVKAMQGDATNLKKIQDDSYDVTLLLGPMYHLMSEEEKLKALSEAKRVTKRGGFIFVGYCMNDYAIIVHGFKENAIFAELKNGRIDKNFHCVSFPNDLYSYVRISDIDKYNQKVGLTRVKIIAPDGAADYMRDVLNKMSDEVFEKFIQYQLSVCERSDLLGASSHVVDILKKE